MTKTCSKCNLSKPITEFGKRSRSKDGHTSECKLCHKLTSKKWEVDNKNKRYANKRKHELANPLKTKARKYKYEYGITLEDYANLLAAQKDCCAICKKHKSEFKIAMHTDHDHKTGKIRGILCQKCNRGLGFFNDNKELLDSAKQYLNK